MISQIATSAPVAEFSSAGSTWIDAAAGGGVNGDKGNSDKGK
jgi:hypothetical protein